MHMCVRAELRVLVRLGRFTEIDAKCGWDERGMRMKETRHHFLFAFFQYFSIV